MAKKKPSLSTVVAFMSDNAQARIEAQSQETTVLPLDSILPDFSQPRRLLPDDLAAAVEKGELAPIDAVQEWTRRAEAGNTDVALRRNVNKLKLLAGSIEQHGLISPISARTPHPNETVAPGTAYLIVTGERRYWAHAYLLSQGKQIHEGEKVLDPARIKATIAAVGVTVKAHQLIENLLREDINAVEKARGMWALRYELSGVNYSSPIVDDRGEKEEVNYSSPFVDNRGKKEEVNYSSPPIDDLDKQQEVNYSSPRLVPWSRVEEALDISKRYRIFVTSVLNLGEDALGIVAGHNLAEMTIRPIAQKLKNKPDLQLKALKQLVAWLVENETGEGPSRAIVASVKDLVEKLLAGEDVKNEAVHPKGTRSVSSAPVIRFRNKVRQTLDFLNRLKPGDRDGLTETLSYHEFADVMIDLRNLRQQIDAILNTVQAQPVDDKMQSPEEERG